MTIASAAKCTYIWLEGDPIEDSLLVDDTPVADITCPSTVRTDGFCRASEPLVNAQLHHDFEPRTTRAVDEAMVVSLVSNGSRYVVQSASSSGYRYEVDGVDESCTCPDWQQRSPEGGGKHLRRIDYELKRGRVPRPDGRLPSA